MPNTKLELELIERERLLFILGAYAPSLPQSEWEQLAEHLEQFTLGVASRTYIQGRNQGMRDAYHREVEDKKPRQNDPMPEQEA